MKRFASLFQFIIALAFITLPAIALADGGSSNDGPDNGFGFLILVGLILGAIGCLAMVGKKRDGDGR